jgi:hypothetical protein
MFDARCSGERRLNALAQHKTLLDCIVRQETDYTPSGRTKSLGLAAINPATPNTPGLVADGSRVSGDHAWPGVAFPWAGGVKAQAAVLGHSIDVNAPAFEVGNGFWS